MPRRTETTPQDTVRVPRSLIEALREAMDAWQHPTRGGTLWDVLDAARAVVDAVGQAAEGEPRQGVIRHWWPDGRQYIAHADDGICDRCTPSEPLCKCGHPLHKAECYDCIRYDVRDVCVIPTPPPVSPSEDDKDARIAELERLTAMEAAATSEVRERLIGAEAENAALRERITGLEELNATAVQLADSSDEKKWEVVKQRVEWQGRAEVAEARIDKALALAASWEADGIDYLQGAIYDLRTALSDPPADAVTLPTTAEQAWDEWGRNSVWRSASGGYMGPAFLEEVFKAGFDAGRIP
jgi:hypothetical protein